MGAILDAIKGKFFPKSEAEGIVAPSRENAKSLIGDPFRSPAILNHSPGHQELIEMFRLEEQFKRERERYEELGLMDSVESPISFDEVLSILTFERLKKAAELGFQRPALLLNEKGVSSADVVNAHRVLVNNINPLRFKIHPFFPLPDDSGTSSISLIESPSSSFSDESCKFDISVLKRFNAYKIENGLYRLDLSGAVHLASHYFFNQDWPRSFGRRVDRKSPIKVDGYRFNVILDASTPKNSWFSNDDTVEYLACSLFDDIVGFTLDKKSSMLFNLPRRSVFLRCVGGDVNRSLVKR